MINNGIQKQTPDFRLKPGVILYRLLKLNYKLSAQKKRLCSTFITSQIYKQMTLISVVTSHVRNYRL
jgi:hypothetical protein